MSIAPLLARIAGQRRPELPENASALLLSRGAFKELAPPLLTGFETLPCSASGDVATFAIVAELEISQAKARMDAPSQFERAKIQFMALASTPCRIVHGGTTQHLTPK